MTVDNNQAKSLSNDTVLAIDDQSSGGKTVAPTQFQQFCQKLEPLMLYIVSMAQFLDIVNGASMTVAMLPIAKELHFEVQQQQWLISSYALSFGGLLLIAGRMGDLFGHRKVFLSGLLWFGIWSLVNGFSKTPVMLCISRALQGIGAAAQIPTALALIAIKYPVGKARTQALSIFGAIGGVFAIPDAPGLHGVSPKIDFGGSFTVTGGLVCVIYYISSGVEVGWASVQTLPVLCAGIVLLGTFIMIEKKISYPIMPFHIWKHRAFSTSFVLIFIMQAAFQGYLYYSTLIFQEILGYPIMKTSLSYLVHGLSGIVVYSILGNFLPRLPLKPIIALGFICLACSGLMFAFVTPTTSYWTLPFFAMIVNVFGLGLVMLPAQITALKDASDDDQGVVGAIYNVGLQIGAPFGLAILTVISGKLNGEEPGPERMHGYKYALFGDVGFALLGLVLTIIFLPNVRANNDPAPTSLEEGGVAAVTDEKDSMTEMTSSIENNGEQKEELSVMPQKMELEESNDQKAEIIDEMEERK
ncbi:hypothetical protein BGZ76_009792 [Entomortierella beljakovae]|nr:hypothetical protein BGZ76_009792 [Entomortierella beljakovae]